MLIRNTSRPPFKVSLKHFDDPKKADKHGYGTILMSSSLGDWLLRLVKLTIGHSLDERQGGVRSQSDLLFVVLIVTML